MPKNDLPARKKQRAATGAKKVSNSRAPAERIEGFLKKKVSINTMKAIPHCNIPGLNLNKTPWVERWDTENVLNLYSPYPYVCDLPKPLLPPARTRRHIYTQQDPATDLIFAKKFIQDDMDTILGNYDNHPKDHTLPSKKDVQWSGKKCDRGDTVLPRYLADLADTIEMDPDPYFEGKYNWYYTGGSISNIYFNDSHLLIFPFMKDLVVTPIILKDNALWKPNLKKATKYTIDNPLYEIRHRVSTDDCRILARCKYECIFYSLTAKGGKITLRALDNKINKYTPFVSADLNPVDFNQYCTFNVGRIFERCDMVSGKCLSKGHINTKSTRPDNWGSIKYHPSNPNIIALTDRNALHYIDLRVSLETPTVTMCPEYRLDNCDCLSLHMPSERPSRHYLGTYHSFLMVDDRCPDQCVHQKWTHQFRTAPLTGSACMRDGNEVIVISSQLATEKTTIVNTWQQFDDPHSYHLPHTVPTIVDTLNQCQLLGTCLDPTLKARLELSSVGSTLLLHDQDIYYFTQSSMEDVFYSCITLNGEEMNVDLINDYAGHALKCWEQEVLKNQEKLMVPLAVTDRFNMEHIFKKFSDTESVYKFVEKESFMPEYWRQPLEKLREYKDILVPCLLNPWEFEDDTPDVLDESEPDNQRLVDWLKSAVSNQADLPIDEENFEAFQPLDDEPVSCTPVLTQELISVSQQPTQPEPEIQIRHFKTESVDFDDNFDNFTAVTKSSKPKKAKKKTNSTYTDGF